LQAAPALGGRACVGGWRAPRPQITGVSYITGGF